jgi:dipeptidyl aminopeptidase/acylaminoacyl peptidase
MRRGAVLGLLAGALLTLGLGGCRQAESTAGRPVAATVVPVSRVPVSRAAPLPEPDLRYPPGSRLARFDLERPGDPPQWLSEPMAAAGGASVSVDGRTLAFVGRQREEDRFAVWLSDARGRERRLLAGAPQGAGAAAWLPDGRLVVAATVEGRPPVAGMASAWALFVVAPEEGSAQRITFGASELDPAVLADGRIVYSQWQPGGDGREPGGGFSLFTVHPDGTGAAALHGYHNGFRLKLQARQTSNSDLVFLTGDDETLELSGMDWGRPEEASQPLETASLLPMSVEPVAAGGLLIAGSEPAGGSGLWLIDRSGSEAIARIAAPEGAFFAHAVEIAPRERPQGHLSMVDPETGNGQLFCIDARPPDLPGAQSVRLTTGRGGDDPRVLGDVPLAADGSFFVVVPSDLPLYLDLLDADGRLLTTTETPIWVRGREVRACVGCHESPLTAPPNRRPLAVLDEPVDLTVARDS